MKLERISAIVQSRAAQARGEPPLPRAGDSLLLTYDQAEGADLLATLSNGLALRLAGLDRWQRELQPGDTLRVKVLANDPVLELELEGAPARAVSSSREAPEAGAAAIGRHSAMRLDQAVLRQMAWQAPNAAALAVSWRDLAQERWGGRLPLQDAARDLSTPVPTTMLGPAPFREPVSTLPAPSLERWMFPVYAWGGAQMLLGLLEQEEDSPSGGSKRERRRQPVLRLELAPAALGRVVLQAHWFSGTIQLSIAVEQTEAIHQVRAALPFINATIAKAGLRLGRVRLTLRAASPSKPGDAPGPATHAHFISQAASLALFRALAEAAVVLLQVVPGQAAISRASR